MPRRFRKLLIIAVGILAIAALTLLSNLFGGLHGGGDGDGPRDRPGGASEGLSGQVTSSTGAPAPSGVRVTVRGAKHRRSQVTDESGRFHFDAVPEGASSVEAMLGPLKAEASVTTDPVTIRLPATCTLAGRVVSASTSEPVRLAVIRCAGRIAQAGERGSFRLEDVPVPDGRPPLLDVSAPDHARLSFRPEFTGAWDDLYLRMKPRR